MMARPRQELHRATIGQVKSAAAKAEPETTTGAHRPVVDTTLIDAMLNLTPEERLRQNDRLLRTIQELRDGFATRRTDDPALETGRSEG
jgi:hypothetical protein